MTTIQVRSWEFCSDMAFSVRLTRVSEVWGSVGCDANHGIPCDIRAGLYLHVFISITAIAFLPPGKNARIVSGFDGRGDVISSASAININIF